MTALSEQLLPSSILMPRYIDLGRCDVNECVSEQYLIHLSRSHARNLFKRN